MSLTIDLTPDEQRRVDGARLRGIDVGALIKGMISALPENQDVCTGPRPGDKTLELLEQWAREDVTDDPQELARRDEDLTEFLANLRANRVSFRIPEM